MSKNVAIDGPSGAGKSSIARQAAQAIGFIYVDTGALYRSIAYFVKMSNADPSDINAIAHLLEKAKIELKFIDGEQRVLLNGDDVSDAIRTPEISMMASRISALPIVREFLFDLQRQIARDNDVIMDGRDIGTVVLPSADVKIFLTASAEIRAKRRHLELTHKGHDVSYQDVLDDIKQRDYDDENREIAPLKRAEDAILVDTTSINFDDSVKLIISTIENNL